MPSLRLSALALSLLVLVACNRNAATPSTPAADGGKAVTVDGEQVETASADQPAEDLGDFRIVSVLLGTSLDPDKVVIGDSEVFGPKAGIHASVLSTGAHQGLRISAKWLGPDGSTVAETEQPVVPTAATATTFGISNPQGWPKGEYQVQIAINGRLQQSRTFQVR